MSEENLRAHIRRMLEVPASAWLTEGGAEWTIHLIDICRAGVAFASARELPFGSRIHIRFSFPDDPGPCHVHGNVVYCKQIHAGPNFRTGVRLEPLSEQDEQRVVDFVTAPHTEELAAARLFRNESGLLKTAP